MPRDLILSDLISPTYEKKNNIYIFHCETLILLFLINMISRLEFANPALAPFMYFFFSSLKGTEAHTYRSIHF